MQPADLKKRVKGFSPDQITADQPHVDLRCEENSLALDYVKRMLLDQDAEIIRIVEDRPQVYKVYYRLSRKRELKVIIDLLKHNTVNIRTVKILSSQFRISTVKRRRF